MVLWEAYEPWDLMTHSVIITLCLDWRSMNELSNRWFQDCFSPQSSRCLPQSKQPSRSLYFLVWEPQRRSKYTWELHRLVMFPTLSEPILLKFGHAHNNADRIENTVCKLKVPHTNAKINESCLDPSLFPPMILPPFSLYCFQCKQKTLNY